MRIGWVGLGKLGTPCALALAKFGGHTVIGYDVKEPTVPEYEAGIDQLDQSALTRAGSVDDVVADADVVFVAVQTPHAPAYGGDQPAPEQRRDFEYGYLVAACRAVCTAAQRQQKAVTLAIVSTVLPGTCNRLVRPLLNPYVTLVYTPAFVAMGTVLADLLNPEFVLVGVDDPGDAQPLRDVYAAVHDQPLFVTGIESAELTKVAYNTVISTKVVIGNTIMEICEKTGADCDQVIDALSLATDRVISPRYLRGGMGDGGACHPRDLIAMSWLAQRLNLSYDLLGEMAKAREAQTGWLADLAAHWVQQTGLDIWVLGTAYKPCVPLDQGSPAMLLTHMLRRREDIDQFVQSFDPYTFPDAEPPLQHPHVYVIGCRHPEFATYDFLPGSVVLDPHGYIPDRPGVTVVRIGRKS